MARSIYRQTIAPLAFAVLCHGGAASAASFDSPSKVVAATVYTSGATVTRSTRVALDAGVNTITLSGLPANLDEARVQIEVADSRVEIGQIRLASAQRSDAVNAEVRELTQALEAARNALQALADSDQAADLTLKFLDGLASGYAKEAWFEGARGSADTASWQAAINVLSEGSSKALADKRDNLSKRAAASAEVSRIERELRNARGTDRATAALTVALRAPAASNTDVRVHYYSNNASWRPLYEARLDSDSGELELAQRAVVYQSSSTDWNNIDLTLSTSEPEGDLERPVLGSEFLDIQPPRRERKSMGRAANGVMAIEEVVVTARKSAPVAFISPEPEVSNFAVTYSVPGKVTVANDADDDQLFDLSRYRFNTRLITQIVPRQSTGAFLAARFTYDQAVPLYGSDMRVYVDGVYAGASQLPTALPQAEVTLPMGQDRRVEVKVTNQGGQRGEQGIIGKRKTEVTDYQFDITNRRNRTTDVEVFDRYPVARNKSIDVDVPRSATEPSATDLDNEPGLIVWRKALDGGASWTIRHTFEVSYPANEQLRRL